jgi:hypothetical protein
MLITCDSKKRSSKYAMEDKDRYDRHVVACVNSDRFKIVNLIGYKFIIVKFERYGFHRPPKTLHVGNLF